MNIKDLDNYHEGETCVIIGNGPSLKDVPLSFLDKYPTFGSNRIYLLSDFTPTYYAAVNPLVISQYSEEISAITCTKFIRSSLARLIDGATPIKSSKNPFGFSVSPYISISEGYTVTYVLMQLAYYMGFTRALLVGVDHRYTYHGKPNQMMYANGRDTNHFSEEYFADDVQWNNPDLEKSARAYQVAKIVYEGAGREIINLTPGTALDVFEREELEKWI